MKVKVKGREGGRVQKGGGGLKGRGRLNRRGFGMRFQERVNGERRLPLLPPTL